MGLRDRIAARYAGQGPDHAALVVAALGDDRYLGHAMVMAAAVEDQSRIGSGGSLGNQLMGKAIGKATAAAKAGKHLGGEPGSLARSLPREGHLEALTFSGSGLTLWDFGAMGTDDPPTLRARLPLASVASLVRTGARSQGLEELRLTFTDGSFFDYRMVGASDGFWAAAPAG